MSEPEYTDWVCGYGYSAKPDDYSPEKYESEVWNGEQWESYGKCAAPIWDMSHCYRVRLRQPARDYSEWVEGKGDSAKPSDYGQNPAKYEVEVWDCDPKVLAWERYRFEQKPLWMKELRYRVRLRREEPITPPATEPPTLNSLIIRPDGCDLVVNGKAVAIPHSAALDLAGELCRSRRQ